MTVSQSSKEFCPYCGAGIGPHRREGEGTCPKCEPILLYDPPSGWMYGFPRPYKPLPNETLAQTLLRDGYPQKEIDNGGSKHCRFIGPIELLRKLDI